MSLYTANGPDLPPPLKRRHVSAELLDWTAPLSSEHDDSLLVPVGDGPSPPLAQLLLPRPPDSLRLTRPRTVCLPPALAAQRLSRLQVSSSFEAEFASLLDSAALLQPDGTFPHNFTSPQAAHART
jgi:hypothetical protein